MPDKAESREESWVNLYKKQTLQKLVVFSDYNTLSKSLTNQTLELTLAKSNAARFQHTSAEAEKSQNDLRKSFEEMQKRAAELDQSLNTKQREFEVVSSNSFALSSIVSNLLAANNELQVAVSNVAHALATNSAQAVSTHAQLSSLTNLVQKLDLQLRSRESQLAFASRAYIGSWAQSKPTFLTAEAHPTNRSPAGLPDYRQWTFRSAELVYDLRNWTNVDSADTNTIELASLTAHYNLRRGIGASSQIYFPFQVSGSDVFPFVYEPFDDKAQIIYPDDETPSPGLIKRLWVNLDRIPPNGEVDLQLGATYINRFQVPGQWRVEFEILEHLYHGSLLIMFPPSKPPLEKRMLVCVDPSKPDWVAVSDSQFTSVGSNYVYLQLFSPRVGSTYAVEWAW